MDVMTPYTKKTNMEALPIEIIRECIMPFTYCPQPIRLCDDIKSYKKCKTYLQDVYNIIYEDSENPEEPSDWMANDICRFLNLDNATMYGFVNFYLEVMRRSFLLHDKTDEYISAFERKISGTIPSGREINTKLGLLSCTERTHLLHFVNHINSIV